MPDLCGKTDPPARRRVGSRCLTRPLLGVRLGPGRQENQHTERPASSPPTHSFTRLSDWIYRPRDPHLRRVVPSESFGTPSARALPPAAIGPAASGHANPPLSYPTKSRDLAARLSDGASPTASVEGPSLTSRARSRKPSCPRPLPGPGGNVGRGPAPHPPRPPHATDPPVLSPPSTLGGLGLGGPQLPPLESSKGVTR